MSKELVVLVIHGMGSQGPDFANDMVEELCKRVDDEGKDSAQIAWKKIYWADILEPRQIKYLNAARRSNDLDYIKLRKFMLTAFGDASAYRHVPNGQNDVYNKIHQRVSDQVTAAYQNDLGSKPKPMIVLAHSLGGHIMSNYIWDMQHSSDTGLSPFERMNYLSGFITFGCNIPLFTFAHDDVVPITFPPAKLPNALKPKAKWLNYYDPDDVLGYPLKSINKAYRKVVNRDIAINAGGIFSSWNPMSHSGYWTDNDFTKPVTKFITTFL